MAGVSTSSGSGASTCSTFPDGMDGPLQSLRDAIDWRDALWRRRSFSIDRSGEAEARRLAIEARKQGQAESEARTRAAAAGHAAHAPDAGGGGREGDGEAVTTVRAGCDLI